MNAALPIIGISMGDPAGIGPEVIVKAWGHAGLHAACRPCVVGDAAVLEAAIPIVGWTGAVRAISAVREARFDPGTLDVIDLGMTDIHALRRGVCAAPAGDAAFRAVEHLIGLALRHEIDATVTAPINKEALRMAGHAFAGHTEIYAHYTHTRDYAMLLVEGNLRVVHVSTHVSMREACERVTAERVLATIRLGLDACRRLGIDRPRLAVAGLNPHAGESGMFGREEIAAIIPAIATARREGADIDGPLPPDTLFPKAAGGMYDLCIAMYHDQGHIPLKLIGFRYDHAKRAWDSVSGVNITLGLPIIRTSVDHGTAFDQAGKGTASPTSLLHAVDLAVKLVRNREPAAS